MAKTVDGDAHPGTFVRNATGLVRDVSPVSATIFNILPAAPGIVLAISLFWILSVFPGGNIFVAIGLVSVIAAVFALTFGLLSAAMPRSGGDYVLVSRSLHPAAGVASSLALSVSSMFALAFVATATVSLGLVPCLSIIGIMSRNKSWTDAATTISSQHWTLALSLGVVLMAAVMNALGMRRLMRVQKCPVHSRAYGLYCLADHYAVHRDERLRIGIQLLRRPPIRTKRLLPSHHFGGHDQRHCCRAGLLVVSGLCLRWPLSQL